MPKSVGCVVWSHVLNCPGAAYIFKVIQLNKENNTKMLVMTGEICDFCSLP